MATYTSSFLCTECTELFTFISYLQISVQITETIIKQTFKTLSTRWFQRKFHSGGSRIPHRGVNLVGCRQLPTQLLSVKFVGQNEKIGSLRGGVRRGCRLDSPLFHSSSCNAISTIAFYAIFSLRALPCLGQKIHPDITIQVLQCRMLKYSQLLLIRNPDN